MLDGVDIADRYPREPDTQQTCIGCGKRFPFEQLCLLGGGGPACLPCADRITRDMETTTGPTD